MRRPVLPELVIFDCDGVLVDSEPISIAVLREVVAGSGVILEEEIAYRRFLGRSITSVAATMEEEFGLAITDGHLADMRTLLYERFRSELRPIPGVAEAIDALTMPRCVASSSQPERIRLSLAVTGLLERLEPHIYSASMVKNGKPAPDLFLHAASAMGASPAACVVVEDSTAGIEAARRAGMRVLAFTGGSHASRCGLREAAAALRPDAIFDDMRQLPALIGALERTGP
ncbi:HAD family hydrolase [Chelatococcus caeni]|uniref:HAD family hydrolase n=1 Tax=Chelatococcus caeni TaxID=1348468 RepID=UPI0016142D11|nr:HAD family hydrolase [Chelatococcus caeni]